MTAATSSIPRDLNIEEREILRRIRQMRPTQRAILVSGIQWAAARRLAARGLVDVKPHTPVWGEEAGYAFPANPEPEAERDRDRRLADEHDQLNDGGEGYVDLLAQGGAR